MKKNCIIILLLVLSFSEIRSQTCCSGGVPLSGNIGFVTNENGLLNFSINYDYNYLNHLYNENQRLKNNLRKRITQSILIQSGYNISKSISIDFLFSLVQQEREITHFNNTDYIRTRGIGDAVVLLKYRVHQISNYHQDFFVGFGSKLPTGKSDYKTASGIQLNADLQPGSGTYDFIYWSHYRRNIDFRPSLNIFGRLIYKQNGTNNEYLTNQAYKFGNEFQGILGISDQLLIKNLLLNPGIAIKYKNRSKDIINDFQLDNTGGDWVFLVTSLGVNINRNFIFNIDPEIPIFTKVDGTQLSTNFRISIGVYLVLNKSVKELNKIKI